MFGTIRKHQTWLWVIIIAAIVITFVYWGAQPDRMGVGGGGQYDFGTIGGEKITLEKFLAARREVELHYFINSGDWPDKDVQRTGFDVDRETFYHLFLLRKASELNLRVESAVVFQTMNNILGGNSLVGFERQILSPRRLTAEDFERYARNRLVIQELAALVGAAGRLVTPEEARAVYGREHEEVSVEVVNFLALDHLANATATPEAVAQFYTNRMASYRLPERVQVSYVAFGLSNHLSAAEAELVKTNLNDMVEMNYRRLGTNVFPEAKTPEEIKAKIREELIRQQALGLAREQAKEFANVVFRVNPPRPENLEKVATEKGLTVKVTEPFDREAGPTEIRAGPAFVQAAFKLTADHPLAGPVAAGDAVHVIALNRRLPSEVPSLESIRAQVTTDYRYEQAVELARQAGTNFLATLTNALAQGKTFSELCLAAKLKPVLLPAFSLSTRSLPQVEQDLPLAQFKQVAFTTPVGKVSDLVYTRDGGMILRVKDRLPLDEAKMQADLPTFTAYLRQVRQSEAFNEWFRRQADEGLRNTALAQMQAAQAKGAAPKKK